MPDQKPPAIQAHESKLRVWLLHDCRPGHMSQLEGLARALEQETNADLRWIDACKLSYKLRQLLSVKRRDDSPHIIIAAGHSTHKALLISARAHDAFCAVIMKPSLPLALFDAIICPQHDGLTQRGKVFNTQGPINKMAPTSEGIANDSRRHRHLFLIGGPSKHFNWSDSALIDQISYICQKTPDIRWTLTDSPRTPASFISAISEVELNNLAYHHYNDTSALPLSTLLADSAFTWLSPDSMSMIYESLTAGSPTALLELEENASKAHKRICRHIRTLRSQGPVISFADWQKKNGAGNYAKDIDYPPKPPTLDEAKRAAQWLLKRYLETKK